jgi:hypothetical protein
MKSPRHREAHNDRYLDCQVALEPLIADALDRAVAAGWSRKETVTALAAVTAQVLLADITNAPHVKTNNEFT